MVDAGLHGEFKCTIELPVMNYEQAINGQYLKTWKQEFKKEHEQIILCNVWRQVEKRTKILHFV